MESLGNLLNICILKEIYGGEIWVSNNADSEEVLGFTKSLDIILSSQLLLKVIKQMERVRMACCNYIIDEEEDDEAFTSV
jgi:hypothetical protein